MPWYIHTLKSIYSPNVQTGTRDGRWVCAVAEPYTAGRLLAAWWVLTGRAYAFAWPKAGDLEDALNVEPRERPKPSPLNPGQRE